jgi:pyruvate/2-oxoglutarate dehydrogenase complex dihydrolipoamide acyltransferase (E2) component
MGDKWFFPVAARKITQVFQPGHSGLDIGVPLNSPLYAPVSGTVQQVINSSTGYGRHVILKTADGKTVILAHLNSFSVQAGQKVTSGQMIGRTGSTGNSTGPHLHYEIRGEGSQRYDPLKMDYRNVNYPGNSTQGRTQAPTQAPTQATSGKALNPTQAKMIAPILSAAGWKYDPQAAQAQTAEREASATQDPGILEKLGINTGNMAVGFIGIALVVIGAIGLYRKAAPEIVDKARPVLALAGPQGAAASAAIGAAKGG